MATRTRKKPVESPDSPPNSFPDVEEIAKIAAMEDAVLRNLRITQAYSELDQAMIAFTGKDDLSWCGFAVWASKTAGTYIRREEVPGWLREWADNKGNLQGLHRQIAELIPRHWTEFGEHIGPFHELVDRILDHVTGAIAEGNRIVFANIAPPFSLMLTALQNGAVSPDDVEAILAPRIPFDKPDLHKRTVAALVANAKMPTEKDATLHAQLALYANAQIGFVEQTNVQPYIVKSLNAPVADLFVELSETRLSLRLPQILGPVTRRIVRKVLRLIAAKLEKEFRHLSTEWLMVLNVPGQRLRLGTAVPPLPTGQMYPRELDPLTDAATIELMGSINALSDKHSYAHDWSVFLQRMAYIGVLFRSRQQEPSLRQSPYNPDQVADMKQGVIPRPPL